MLLYNDGTIAWINTDTLATGEPSDRVIGNAVWNRCGPEDQDAIRDSLANLLLDHKTGSVDTIVHNLEGRRFMVSMSRLPVIQPSQHAVVGWFRPLCDEVLLLSNREREVLELVCEELTSEQIAAKLHIALSTVETHRQNISKKLGTNSVVGQVRAAIRGGLIQP